ncbi:hypothetical protein [Streptomyces sp. CO7]
MLLTWIAEVAEEPLALEPGDRRVEWRTNTWWLSAEAEDDGPLSAAEVVAAFGRTAARIRERVRGLGFRGVATFYVWHDRQAGQLRCSTGSVPPEQLPFNSPYVLSDRLDPLVEEFLADSGTPGAAAWSDLTDADSPSHRTGAEPEAPPLRVWTSDVGATR